MKTWLFSIEKERQDGGHEVRDVLWEQKKVGIAITTFPVSIEKKKENGNGESA